MTHVERRNRRRKIADAVKSGMHPHDASQKFAVSYSIVGLACRENGVKLSKFGRFKTSTYAIIAELFGDKPLTTISKEQSLSFTRVQEIYKACLIAKIPIKRRLVGRRPNME